MPTRERVRKYRETGGAADLVRVEVLVPKSSRQHIVAAAAEARAQHRLKRDRLRQLCAEALTNYRVRVLDNIDLDRLQDDAAQARVIARALMERGDARAFVLGRRILAEAGSS